MPPFLWSVLENFIPDSWPDGNPGRLRASATAWQSFASTIDGITNEMSGPSGVVGAQKIPEGGAMTSAMSKLSTSLSAVVTEAKNLATQTNDFADDVQSTQDAIRDLCDRISPSGIFGGIKAVFSGDALDEMKAIAHDVQEVLENFGRQVDGKISLMQALITALDDSVVSLQQGARREFTHYLGDEVGGALASAFEFQSNVGEGIIKAGLGTVVGVQSLDPMRFASDSEGARAAWGGVLDTIKYATPGVVAMDPGGAYDHGKEMLGGILHAEDWRADRPGLGLGGVLFEAGSAATGIGAAKTGLRGASAAADLGETGQAVRAVAGGADAVAPIAGRGSEIAGSLDDLTTFPDGIPSGATPGTHGPAAPPSLTERNVPQVPEAPRVSETSTPRGLPDSTGPRAVPDGPAPRPAELPPDASGPRAEVNPQNVPDAIASRASEPAVNHFGAAAPEGSRPPVGSTQSAESLPSRAMPEPAMAESGSGATHANEMSPSGSSGGGAGTHPWEPPSPPVVPEPHSGGSHGSSPHTSDHGSGTLSHSDDLPDDSHRPHGGHSPDEPAPHDDRPGDAGETSHHDETVRTDDLQHPHSDLLDMSELDAARDSPTRVTDALANGLPSSDPQVAAIIPEGFDKYGGLGRDAWEEQYWPSGETDTHGNPKLTWPDSESHPEGFLSPEDRRPAVLEPGSNFDRFGPGFGRFVSPDGTLFPERGLPFQSLDDGYHRYEVVKPLPIWEGPIAPAMGQPGGGIQYFLPYPVVDLLIAGYIREVT